RALGLPVDIIPGGEEANLSAFGVASFEPGASGLVGDMGGGSLELIHVHGSRVGHGTTLPLGGLRLQDVAGNSPRKAEKIAAKVLSETDIIGHGARRDFYAIGGTWRALARLHMHETGYPLHVMHHYEIAPDEMLEFCRIISRRSEDALSVSGVVSKSRQPLLPYGAVALAQIIETARPTRIVMSALGVREGLLYSLLDTKTKRQDPLLSACEELAVLRARAPQHARELGDWTTQLFAAAGIAETEEEARLRTAACLVADTGWRAHPDYRGEQSLNILAHAAFIGIDHPGRAYLSLAVFFRHVGLVDDALSPRMRELASTRLMERARLLGAALRVAYLISAATDGVIPQTRIRDDDGVLTLVLPPPLGVLDGEQLQKRLSQLSKLLGMESKVVIEG
ncbi:MAG: Ppx/GppA family phosphatase, partial [Hyphomicrobiales bacterium]|nr:Ppx/GppA family phosphatase [Hyphomicrobiales bacterium]